MEKADCVVIGAGVVGLAVARKLSSAGREVLLLESAEDIGSGISSRNSEVIHAGIYYPADSLKARFCVAGKQLLYQYCAEHFVPVRQCGKLIVATAANKQDALRQLDTLRDIEQRALRNKVSDLQWLTSAEVAHLEPAIACEAALLSPSTGIVDTHALMVSLLGEAEAQGALLALGTTVTGLTAANGRIRVDTVSDEPLTLDATTVVNCAGFGVLDLARGALPARDPEFPVQVLAKGNYFGLLGAAPVQRLIYPVPETGGLGVHITLDMAGRVRFGPDVEWIDEFDYAVDPVRAEKFYAAIRTYLPGLADNALVPDYAGIRPKLSINGEICHDFLINGPVDHGVEGLINLMGIESPGLTASLAIAEYVSQIAA